MVCICIHHPYHFWIMLKIAHLRAWNHQKWILWRSAIERECFSTIIHDLSLNNVVWTIHGGQNPKQFEIRSSDVKADSLFYGKKWASTSEYFLPQLQRAAYYYWKSWQPLHCMFSKSKPKLHLDQDKWKKVPLGYYIKIPPLFINFSLFSLKMIFQQPWCHLSLFWPIHYGILT